MLTKSKYFNFTGYIEGYYGKLLSWNERFRIVKKLSSNKMTSYFYAPKEDIFHRLQWRKLYPNKEIAYFKEFLQLARKKKINVIMGIAPGLDFEFKNIKKYNHLDLKVLKKKCKQIISFGISNIALMFDDIEASSFFNTKVKNNEGEYHAFIANYLKKKLNINIYIVPRVYSDELFSTNKYYLKKLCENLDENIKIFYCGKNIVAKSIDKNIFKKFESCNSQIIVWDNFYANDYCPKKIFLGHLKKRFINNNIMINATGMIETDLMLIDLYNNVLMGQNSQRNWKKLLKVYDIPNEFFLIAKYVDTPFNEKIKYKYSNIEIKKQLDALDYLLWKWKTPISREWYTYLFNLKNDILINCKKISNERIYKIETPPLARYITKKN